MNLDNASNKEAKEIYDAYRKILRTNWAAKECSIECINRIISACATDARVYYEEVKHQIEKL